MKLPRFVPRVSQRGSPVRDVLRSSRISLNSCALRTLRLNYGAAFIAVSEILTFNRGNLVTEINSMSRMRNLE